MIVASLVVALCIGEDCRPAKEPRVEAAESHQLTVKTSDASHPAVQLRMQCGEQTWTWALESLPKRAIDLRHPAGDCNVTVTSDGYRTVEAPIAAKGTLYLRKMPVISGVVTDAVTGTPVPSTQVLHSNGELLDTTDDQGRYRIVVERDWPSWLRVGGRRTVLVPKAVADVHLPVTLPPGGSVVLALEPPLGAEELRWEARLVIDESSDQKVRTGSVAAGEKSITVEGLEPGPYRFIVLGEGPLQRFAVPVSVEDAVTKEAAVRIEPALLTIETPKSGMEVFLVYDEGQWQASLKTGEQGQTVEELWQRGSYLATVEAWSESRRIDEDDTTWRLDVPDRVVRGQVTDAATKRAVANAVVVLETKRGMLVERSAADGTYAFSSVPTGRYTLRVELSGYRSLKLPPVELAAETHLEERDLTLQPVTGRLARVLNAAGVPLPNTLVHVSSRNGTRVAGLTADDGTVMLPVTVDESGAAFALPSSGSFGVVRFASIVEAGDDEVVVRVPDGVASLEVQTHSTDGNAIGGLSFLMRYNGILIPLNIKEDMHNYQGVPLSSDAAGRLLLTRMPPGRYEIWPLASRDDLRAVASAAPPPAAVNVMLTPGHHIARMVFKPKDQG